MENDNIIDVVFNYACHSHATQQTHTDNKFSQISRQSVEIRIRLENCLKQTLNCANSNVCFKQFSSRNLVQLIEDDI